MIIKIISIYRTGYLEMPTLVLHLAFGRKPTKKRLQQVKCELLYKNDLTLHTCITNIFQ